MMPEVTQILADIRSGKAEVADLVQIVHGQLRGLAAEKLANERPGHTLQVTALVNEAYLRLFGADPQLAWENRAHFFAAAAEAMRRILVDYARRRRSQKRGGNRQREPLRDDHEAADCQLDEVLDIDHFLGKLAQQDAVRRNW
jgi:RNA polymerase sigma factor (TIGR02999 family)